MLFLFFRIVFDVVNMLQGVWIFTLFIIFNPEAKKLLHRQSTNSSREQEIPLSVYETQELVQNKNQ